MFPNSQVSNYSSDEKSAKLIRQYVQVLSCHIAPHKYNVQVSVKNKVCQ